MGRPRSTDSRTDPAILEYRRQYYYEHKNRLLEAAKARYAAKAMVKEKKEKEQKPTPTEETIKEDKQFYEEWLSQLKNKLPTAKGWLITAIQNQITLIEQQINAKSNTKECNDQTDWETDI